MDTTTIYKQLPIHKHPLLPAAPFTRGKCSGCHLDCLMYNSYTCNDPSCDVWFHKECAEAPLEINHPSHTQHPLLLTNDSGDGPCDMCGQKLLPPCYSCTICEFKVDLACGMKPSLLSIEHPACHEHPLVFLKKREEESHCEVCKDSIGGPSYSCLECRVYFHVDCVHFSTEVNHPCHSNHPLKFTALSLLDDGEKICFLCGEPTKNVLYHCSICYFIACLFCTMKPPPLVIEDIKTHKHPLTLFSRRISYTCDACGLEGNLRAYICLQCDFVVHGNCIGLPRVININRHDHRIYFTQHLGAGYSHCGVCHQSVSEYYGAYSCSVCPKYAVHSRCAARSDYNVWDGVELEGIPEDTKYIAPFKVVGDDLISHFSHREHNLTLQKDNIVRDKWLQCEACMYHVGFDPIYSCEECGFVLHEKCANLPMKKRLVFSTVPYTLEAATSFSDCPMCKTLSNGFKYMSQTKRLKHVHCGSLSEPLVHDGHLHPLYFYKSDDRSCNGCNNTARSYVLRCDACDFNLCFYCASLPGKIWHRKDEHPLTLYCGEKLSIKNWCDTCEREIDPKWFYTCYDCGVTLHARCVLGDFSRLKLGHDIYYKGKSSEVVPNNHNTRPLCSQCHARCNVSVILKERGEVNGYICSRSCLYNRLGKKL